MSSETDPFTASAASGGLQASTRRRPLLAFGQALCRLLWGVILPALLTGLVLRYRVRPVVPGEGSRHAGGEGAASVERARPCPDDCRSGLRGGAGALGRAPVPY